MSKSFREELNASIQKYGEDSIDVYYSNGKVFGMYHSNNNSFPTTREHSCSRGESYAIELANRFKVGFCSC